MVSQKQLKANRKNAPKGGVKTQEGKEIVKYNALRHGLLAREVVITVGEGAENPEEFSTLLEDLKTQLKPDGVLEEMLTEKIAVAYWRLRRAYKYEVGLLRKQLDNTTDDYFSQTDWEGKKNKTDEEIEQQVEEEKHQLEEWKKDKTNLSRMYKAGTSLKKIYQWGRNWEQLYYKFSDIIPEDAMDDDEKWTMQLSEFLKNNKNWSDDQIWQAHIELCCDEIKHHKEQVLALGKEKAKNKLKLQVIKKLGNIPSKYELDRLLRYEGAIERQLYKAMNQLERLQRMRSGDNVPPPVEVDLDVNNSQNG